MREQGAESQTIASGDVGSMPADIAGSTGPATLDPAKAATPEEAAAADPHFRPVLHDTISELQNLRPPVEVDVELPHPEFARAVAGETVKEKRTVPGFAFERKPLASGEVLVALVERDGGDRLSGRGKDTAEAVANLREKMKRAGMLVTEDAP